jgi:hypothetical protein
MFVSGVRRCYRYSRVRSLASLKHALLSCRPDIVVPCDDGAVAQLHALYREEPAQRGLLVRSLGPPDSYPILESRYQLLTLAAQLGVRVPTTARLTGERDLGEWHASHRAACVVKVDGESGGNGVRICSNFEEARAAWSAFLSPPGAATAWKRTLIDLDPLAVWQRGREEPREITIQEFIEGRPANSMMACWRGELLAQVSVIVVAAEGSTGAATIVRRIHNEDMTAVARRLAAHLRLSGFYGLDFVFESRTSRPYLIEVNPRCTQLGHLEFADQGSLAGVFSAALREVARPRAQSPVPQETIALFPQAMYAGEPCRGHLEASYHDMPMDEPRLREQLLLRPWPYRRWLARTYHAMRPLTIAAPLIFEPLALNEQRAANTL